MTRNTAMSDIPTDMLIYKNRHLPSQVHNAREKYLRLVAEARELRMGDVLTEAERREGWGDIVRGGV